MPIDPKLIPNDPTPLTDPDNDVSGGVETLQRLQHAHGGLIGQAAPVLPQNANGDSIPQKDPYYLYTFTDGTQALVNGTGQVNQLDLHAGSAVTGYTDIKENKNPDGTADLWGTNKATGTYEKVAGAPNIPAVTPQDAGSHPAIPTQDGKMMVWDPTAPNPNTGGKGYYVDSGAPANPTAAAKANADLGAVQAGIGKTSADQALTDQQIQVLKDKTPVEIDELKARGALSQAQADQIYSMLPVNKAATVATTAKTTAETGQITTATDIAARKAPGEIQLTQAQIDEAKARALAEGRPTQVTAGTDSPTVMFVDSSGNVQSKPNTAYQPKDPGRAVMDLQAQMTAKAASLSDAVRKGSMTQPQMQDEWNRWYSQNVEPMKADIAQAQQQQQLTNQISVGNLGVSQQNAAAQQQTADTGTYTAQVAGQTAASNIGTAAVNAAIARPSGQLQVGPGFGDFMGQLTKSMYGTQQPGNLDWGKALEYQTPDTSQIYENATAQALKNISPMAAQKAGAPLPTVPGGIDVNSMLSNNLGNYTPMAAGGGTAAASSGGAGGGPVTAALPVTATATPVAASTPGAVSPVGTAGAPGGPFQPSAALQAAPTLATQPTLSAPMDPSDPNYLAWLQAQMGKYQPQAA
jgi:hypothetical protein